MPLATELKVYCWDKPTSVVLDIVRDKLKRDGLHRDLHKEIDDFLDKESGGFDADRS